MNSLPHSMSLSSSLSIRFVIGWIFLCAIFVFQAGAAAEAVISVPVERLRYWDTERKQYVVERGQYELLVGAASEDIRLRTSFKIEK
jgi:hypothetical protein